MHETVRELDLIGLAKIPSAVDYDQTLGARNLIYQHIHLFRNTRQHPSSGHLAGFHRYPQLEPLHGLLSGNHSVLETLELFQPQTVYKTIGLSDITINRSQPWHTDLLRGSYQEYLDVGTCWGDSGGGVYKVLFYLQRSSALRYIPGSHKIPVPLDADNESNLISGKTVQAMEVNAGDLVMMDIRLIHRGSTDEEVAFNATSTPPKILVSTVLGGENRQLTAAMEMGNARRLIDWERRHSDSPAPQLGPHVKASLRPRRQKSEVE